MLLFRYYCILCMKIIIYHDNKFMTIIIIVSSSILEIQTIIKLNKFAKYVHPKLSGVHLLSRTIPPPIPTIPKDYRSYFYDMSYTLHSTHYSYTHHKYPYINTWCPETSGTSRKLVNLHRVENPKKTYFFDMSITITFPPFFIR